MKAIDIKFKGKCIDSDYWVEGHYFQSPLTQENANDADIKDGWFFLTGKTRHCIEKDHNVYIVDPETVELVQPIAPTPAPKEDTELENKLIDFANWYLRLIKVTNDQNERFDIENRNIVWSFLRGDDYKLWWNKIEAPKEEEKDPKMIDGSYSNFQCFDPEKDLWANINCRLQIATHTCGRGVSCPDCPNYLVKEEERTTEDIGDELCKYCDLEKKGVYSVPGGFAAGCEGSRCDVARENFALSQRKEIRVPNNEEIQNHIAENCRDKETGSVIMDEQAYYEGAKWMCDQITSKLS